MDEILSRVRVLRAIRGLDESRLISPFSERLLERNDATRILSLVELQDDNALKIRLNRLTHLARRHRHASHAHRGFGDLPS